MKIRTALFAAVLASGALLAAGSPASAAGPGIGTYKIVFHTGDLDRAGTDASVWLTVHGTLGDSPVKNLDNDDDNFERNKTDVFGSFNWLNIGTATSVTVKKGTNGSEWFPSYVQIYSQTDGHVQTCEIGEWFGTRGPDLERDYNCATTG